MVRVTNNVTTGWTDVPTNASGVYSAYITGDDGDSITVKCNSAYRKTSIDLTVYPTNKTVNLVAFTKFIIDGNTITGIVSVVLNKVIGNTTWESVITLENKNGYRSTDYTIFDDIELYIDDRTVMKGRIKDLDITTDHRLIVICENYSALLNDRYVQNDAFDGKTIYYAITDSTHGVVTPYLPSINIGSIPNNTGTQNSFTKTFNKETVGSCLTWLGNLSSAIGYDFYVDNDKVLQFKERRSICGGVTLSNVGRFRNVFSWDWREASGKDIYNRVVVYGKDIVAIRDDLASQTTYGVREHPPITDESLLSTLQCNNIGDNIIARYSNPFKEADINTKNGVITNDSNFDQQFPLYFETDRMGIILLEPGDTVAVKISGSGVNDVVPEQRVILEIKHTFPQYITHFKLSEYSKNLSSLLSDTTQKGYK